MEEDPKKDHKKKKSKSKLMQKEKEPAVDEANLPQVKVLTDEQKDHLEQFRATVTKLVADQDAEIAAWALGTSQPLGFSARRDQNRLSRLENISE